MIIVRLLLISLLMLNCFSETNAQRQGRRFRPLLTFVTVTQVSTVTRTSTSSRVGYCVKLVNVTGQCRKRRGESDEPIILMFDDGMDTDNLFIQPSPALNLETTEPTGIIRSERKDPVPLQIQSSKEEPGKDGSSSSESKVFFQQLSQIFNNPFRTITRVVLYTTTTTSYIYVDTSTKTFFIQYCTPSALNYATCPSGRKR